MENQTIIDALVLGLLEGLTEFIPVSSTGHILLAGHFLGFQSTGKAFEILIQLGAILAILTVYSARLLKIATDLPRDARTRRFVLGVLIAFLPAAFLGVIGHGFIKTVLFETPKLICVMLLLGGLVLLVGRPAGAQAEISRRDGIPAVALPEDRSVPVPRPHPGTSRSGSTIVGALLMGTDKRSAAEFSFFLAMPTMAGAFAYDLYKNRDVLSAADLPVIGVGFVAAFVMAVIVVRYLLDYVSRHGFALFAWWRLIVGAVGLAASTSGAKAQLTRAAKGRARAW